MQDSDHISIEILKLSRRVYRALLRSHIMTVGDIRQLSLKNNLLEIRLIGKRGVDEISMALDELYKNMPQFAEAKKTLSQPPTMVENVDINVDALDQVFIDYLQLPGAILRPLKKNKVRTVGELRKLSDRELLNINRIGLKSLGEIRQIIAEVVNHPDEYIAEHTIRQGKPPKPAIANAVPQVASVKNWAEIVQSYFEREKSTYTYVLISRFGYKPKKLEEIAIEFGVTRERVRQIQELVGGRFLRHVRQSGGSELLKKITEILSKYGEGLSLRSFKTILMREGILGQFSNTITTEYIKKLELLETLICWLNLLSDKRYSMTPVVFSVDIRDLVLSGNLSMNDRAALLNISPKARRKIRRKVLFTGGITIKESAKILSTNEIVATLLLESLNLQKVDGEWFSFKNLNDDKENSKIPLRVAGIKMLAVNPEMEVDTFSDGLRRHVSRFYSSMAPKNVVEHVLPILGFEISNRKVKTKLATNGVLSQSEKSLISAISKNDKVASFLEIAEEFFLQRLSLPAVSVTLKRSPIVEKVDDGLYKLRGTDISWQQIEIARKRQKRFSQDDEIVHGLDGVIRMKFTVNSYTFLTGVVGASNIKALSGPWSVLYHDKSCGNAKIDEAYLWGLSKAFKMLDVKMGDRIELGFNTWNRSLFVEKVNYGTSR